MRKRGWILLLILLLVAFLMSCGKKEEPDGGIGELVRIQWEGATEEVVPSLFFLFWHSLKGLQLKKSTRLLC